MKSSQIPSKNLPMVGTTMVGHIHIMIIELLMKLDVILKNVGCTVTKMLDHNRLHLQAPCMRKAQQFCQNRTGCDLHAHEGRCHAERAAQTSLQYPVWH